ncbi:MAG TPA: hypothetical protein DCM05_11150 [Elusimicrobia bacterium]|nr:hypothetical protein [Elusimicrobiota bacterium]
MTTTTTIGDAGGLFGWWTSAPLAAKRALVAAGLRDRVEVWCDAGIKSALDVAKLMCLGADRCGFGTFAMVAIGCTICRGCQLDTCHVGIATQIESAVEATRRQPFDLILMDIMMPDVDGITLTQEIRSDPKTSSIPILIVSGLSDAGTLEDALLYGAVDYVVKPLDFALLKTKIERIFALTEKRQ